MKQWNRRWGVLLAATLFAWGAGGSMAQVVDLNRSMVWVGGDAPPENGFLHAGFRREFQVTAGAGQAASLQIFAYTRYQLFVNGEYVGRGPNRFENKRPEFDEWDVGGRLKAGKNVIAVLVHRDQPSGRVMKHAPGLAVRLEGKQGDGVPLLVESDESWKGFVEESYGPQKGVWASFPENIDARRAPGGGDWTAVDYESSEKLPAAVKVDVSDAAAWPAILPRTIPHMREEEIPWTAEAKGEKASVVGNLLKINDGGEMVVTVPRVVLAYYNMRIDAPAGVKVQVTPLLPENAKQTASSYTTREGKQRWISGDVWAMRSLSIKATGGVATIRGLRLVEVLYPFETVGRFKSSDPLLDRIWAMTTRSTQLMSEDAYTDCADRERVEWMDCDPPAYDVTRAAFAGPGEGGTKLYSDPRLMKNMLLRTALTQRADGMVKAHTCSERWDIHAIMEDRACDWVEGMRKYYEATADDAFLAEMWPHLDRFCGWITSRRTDRGLVLAREWVAWDNPLAYATCEGTANNAFFYRALADAAFLAKRLGRPADAARLDAAARELRDAANKALWNDAAGAYAAAIGMPVLKKGDDQIKKKLELKSEGDLVEPTLHANLFALDRGLVPPERREKVVAWTLAHEDQVKQVMANHFYFKLLYGQDTAQADQRVLDRIRRWRAMADSPWGTTWEFTNGGSKVHIYGAVPAYFLSTYVLGVRRDAPVWEKRLVIQPRLGDLASAEGAVSTEFGLVEVSWKKRGDAVDFQLTVPPGVEAEVHVPAGPLGKVTLNGGGSLTALTGRWRTLTLGGGTYSGTSE